MRFALEVRIVQERDLCLATPFLPEIDQHESYLDTLHEELSCIHGIAVVERSGSVFLLETADEKNLADVKVLIKPAFTASILSVLRYVSLSEA